MPTEHIALTKNEYRILLTPDAEQGEDRQPRKAHGSGSGRADSFVDENTLTVNVGRLRKKLENGGTRTISSRRSSAWATPVGEK